MDVVTATLPLWQTIIALLAILIPGGLSLIKLYNRVGILETENTSNKDHLRLLETKQDETRRALDDIRNILTKQDVNIEYIKEKLKNNA